MIGIGYFWQSFTIVHCLLVAKSHLIKAKLHHFISLNVYYFIWDNKFYQFLNCQQAIKWFQVTSYQMIYFHVMVNSEFGSCKFLTWVKWLSHPRLRHCYIITKKLLYYCYSVLLSILQYYDTRWSSLIMRKKFYYP